MTWKVSWVGQIGGDKWRRVRMGGTNRWKVSTWVGLIGGDKWRRVCMGGTNWRRYKVIRCSCSKITGILLLQQVGIEEAITRIVTGLATQFRKHSK